MDHADKTSVDTSGIPGLKVVPFAFHHLHHFDLLHVILIVFKFTVCKNFTFAKVFDKNGLF